MPVEHYAAFLDLTGRRCVVIGRSEQKVAALRACGADVVLAHEYEPALLDDAWLVVVVDREQGERVYADATERRVFCNVEDVPELCTFILPAILRRGPITLAVSTGGASPALAQRLRDDLGAQIGFEHEQLAHELQRLRPWVKRNLHSYEERRDFFRDAVSRTLGAARGAEFPGRPSLARASVRKHESTRGNLVPPLAP